MKSEITAINLTENPQDLVVTPLSKSETCNILVKCSSIQETMAKVWRHENINVIRESGIQRKNNSTTK